MKASRLYLSVLKKIQSVLIQETNMWSEEGKSVLYSCGLYVTRKSIMNGPVSDGEVRLFKTIEQIIKSEVNCDFTLNILKVTPSIFCSIEVLGKLLVGIVYIDHDDKASVTIGSSFDPMHLNSEEGYSLSSYIPVVVPERRQNRIQSVNVSKELSLSLASKTLLDKGNIPLTVISIREEKGVPVGRDIIYSCERYDPDNYKLDNVVKAEVVDSLLDAICKEVDLPLKMVNFIYNGNWVLNRAVSWMCPDGEYVLSYYYKP